MQRLLPYIFSVLTIAPAPGLGIPSKGDEPDKQGAKQHPANHLINSASPYLLQHARNPVDWYPWSKEAFDRAKAEDKPIFLSIGYAACHWCHVMERESFENEEIARILNENFIAIKVDREERPDIDEIYMAATQAMTGRGGWPMSVFMTPDRKPFLCGTYFPPEDRRGRRGLRGLCLDIAARWKTDRPALLREASTLTQKVQNRKRTFAGVGLPTREAIARNVDRLAQSFDPVLGGRRSRGTKFPPTMAMELMLREYVTPGKVSKPHLIDLVETTLARMADGGIYDQIGGGICRYSTDPRWFAPHFEKMLYDQGTVSGVYLSAFQLTHKRKFGEVARGILDYCLDDLQSPSGGFYSSRDADSEGEEGKYYVWRASEINALLPAEDAPLLNEYYNVTARGNWHGGQNILNVKTTDQAFASKHGMDVNLWRKRLAEMKRTLRAQRAKRVVPKLDDKILAEWNGLLITSLARGYRILDEPRYRDAAVRAADFVLKEMVEGGRLFRAHRAGTTHIPGYGTDYANMIEALITLYETTFDRRWLSAAERLNTVFIELFHDDAGGGGFFYTAKDAEALLVRSKNTRDGVVPSVNATTALNLLRLAILLDRPDLRKLGEETLTAMQRLITQGRLERNQWAVLFYHAQPKEIAIVGDPADSGTQALIAQVYRNYLPNKVVALGRAEDARKEETLTLLKRKTLVRGKPGAYVCRDYVCGRPVSTPEGLAKQLTPDQP